MVCVTRDSEEPECETSVRVAREGEKLCKAIGVGGDSGKRSHERPGREAWLHGVDKKGERLGADAEGGLHHLCGEVSSVSVVAHADEAM